MPASVIVSINNKIILRVESCDSKSNEGDEKFKDEIKQIMDGILQLMIIEVE